MGSPIRIADLAQHMINRSGRSISIEYMGLRPGEKEHEVLISAEEQPQATSHELVTSSRVLAIDLPGPTDFKQISWIND
jgi:FlaA1/EpsC-like NDP-sugar epimerase